MKPALLPSPTILLHRNRPQHETFLLYGKGHSNLELEQSA